MKRFLKDRSGATAIEYSMIAVVVMVAIVTSTGIMGERAKQMFESLVTGWEAAQGN